MFGDLDAISSWTQRAVCTAAAPVRMTGKAVVWKVPALCATVGRK
jgi:hypothetical protein